MRRAAVLMSVASTPPPRPPGARAAGYSVGALSVDYGQHQRHGARGCDAWLPSTSENRRPPDGLPSTSERSWFGPHGRLAVPKDRVRIGSDVPITYVPARNTVLLALLTRRRGDGATDLVIGANVQDYSGYPDCRPEFLRALADVARLGTRAGRRGCALHGPGAAAPPVQGGIVRLGRDLGLDHALTLSATTPPRPLVHCGHCDACCLRRAGFLEADVPDPSTYRGLTRRARWAALGTSDAYLRFQWGGLWSVRARSRRLTAGAQPLRRGRRIGRRIPASPRRARSDVGARGGRDPARSSRQLHAVAARCLDELPRYHRRIGVVTEP